MNAFAHSDYENIPEIEIGIHSGKIEIYNPGTFPEDLTPLDFIDKNLPSYRRNKLILDVLFRSKDVEKSGTGFQRVNELCLEAGVSWSFRKEAFGFFFEFIRSKTYGVLSTTLPLSENEKEILTLLNSNPNLSKIEPGIRINKSEKTVQRSLESLIKKGLIVRTGSRKTGRWEIVQKPE